MRLKLLLVAFASFVVVAPVAAQPPNPYPQHCPPGTVSSLGVPDQARATQDACVKAIDLFKFLTPQLAAVLAGGNAILGTGGTLGGFGHISFGLRANAIAGDLPRVDRVTLSTSGATATNFETRNQFVALPTADLALGIFGGLPLGLTNVGGVDLLVSASYLPEFSGNNVSVRVPGGSIQLGYGARLGIIQESLVWPSVGVSVLRRGLPTVNVSAQSGSDSIALNEFDITATSWRLTASKSFLMFGLTVGGGRDRYSTDADLFADVAVPFGGRATATILDIGTAKLNNTGPDLSRLNRTNYFANLSMHLPFFRLIGEIGQVSGGEITHFNNFSGKEPDKSRVYGSIGARIGW
jgi:hypothetical protein